MDHNPIDLSGHNQIKIKELKEQIDNVSKLAAKDIKFLVEKLLELEERVSKLEGYDELY